MNRSIISIFVLFLTLHVFTLKASHVAGGDISYEHLSGDSFLVTLKIYRDCSGITVSTVSEYVNFTSSCGVFDVALPFVDSTEVSQLCDQSSANSTCNGGNLPGMEEYIYQGIVVLTPCADWNMYFEQCCRNDALNVLNTSSNNYYVNTTLNNVISPENNSVVYSAQPIPYVCLGQTTTYNFGSVETDGDSLVFSLICPFSDPFTSMSSDFDPPYTCTNPIDGITIDATTGELNFTPNTVGNFIVAVEVIEYNDAGLVIGSAVRDIQFVVQVCSNNVPDDTSGVVQNLLAPANLLNAYQVELCEGDTLSFDAVYTDQDAIDTLTITTNLDLVLPGATYSISGINPITVHYEWVVPGGTAGTNTAFTVTVNDGACPIPGLQFFVYDINIVAATIAGPDQIICGPATELPGQAVITVTGGTSFQWTSISGAPIVVGTNFSCDTCSTIIATPAITTTYVVSSNLSSSCQSTDTVTVFVVPDFTFSTTLSDDSICMLDIVQFTTTPNPNTPGYIYDWNAAGANLNDDSIFNPLATFVSSGAQNIYLNITSPMGCLKRDTFMVQVSPNIKPEIEIVGDSTVCFGDSTLLFANNLSGQDCYIILDLHDTYGDGWNGNILDLYIDGVFSSSHTILNVLPGNVDTIAVDTVYLSSGSIFSISYDNSGSFQGEVYYNIYDASGNLLFTDGTNPSPGFVFTDTIICGSSSLNFSWSPTNSLSDPNGQQTWAFPTTNTTYTVIAVDPIGGCMDVDSFNVYVVPTFGITVTASEDSICLLDQIQYEVTADSAFTYTYLWTPSNIMNDPAIFNPVGTHTTPGLIPVTVEVTSALGCTKEETVYVEVSQNIVPNINIVGDSTICEGDSTLLIVQNANASGCTFVINMEDSWGDGWNGAELTFLVDGVVNSVHTIPSGSYAQSDTITITSGSIISINTTPGFASYEASFEILDGDGNILFSIDPIPFSTTTNLWVDTFYCAASSLNYTWSPSTGLSNTTNDSVWVYTNTNTTYYVTATDPVGGCMDVDSFNVYVVPTFAINVTASDDSICLNEEVQYNVTTDSLFTFTYTWSPSNIMSNPTIVNPIGTHTLPGLIPVNVLVSSAEGCTKYDEVLVLVSNNPTPNLSITGNDTICEGDSTNLFANNSSSQDCYIILDLHDTYGDGWNDNFLNVYIDGVFSSTHTIFNVLPGNADSTGIDTVYLNSGSIFSIFYDDGGSYQGEVFYNIYDASGNLLFADGTNPTPGFVFTDTIICGNETLDFTWSPTTGLSSPNEQETWASPAANTTYTVIAIDPIGACSDTASINIVVIPAPIVEVTTTDTMYCINEPIQTLQATPTPGTWSGPFISTNGQFLPLDLGLGSETYVYSHFNGGCWGYDTITIYVANPPSSPSPTAYNPYCAGRPLNDLTIDSDGGEITWYSNASLTNEINPNTTGASNTTLYVTETDGNNCTSDPAPLLIQTAYTPNVNFEFEFDSATAEAPLTIEFDNQSSPVGANYTWFINGDLVGSNYDLTYLFENGGIYTITLVGLNPAEGCMDSLTKVFNLYEFSISNIPNVISPNGDNINDKFYLKSLGLQDITMSIYNRWGKVVYGPCGPVDNASTCAWDGGDHPSGTYYYIVTAKDRDGKAIKRNDLNGYITLIKD
jgi:gliding motility-associated-like protein